jgi:di/tricarboxylate transporter
MIAFISLVALVVAVIIGIVRPKINIGVLSIGFAFIIGFFFLHLKEKEITALFPSSLFLMLVFITFLFSLAAENGTLQQITNILVGRVQTKPILLPLVFFALTFLLSAMGPGNIAAVALIAPLGMVLAYNLKLSPFLMAIMICTGANAGAFSPIAPTGVISTGLIQKIGVESAVVPWIIFGASALIQSLSAIFAYFGFLYYFKKRREKNNEQTVSVATSVILEKTKFSLKQKITLFSLALLLFLLICFKIPLILSAFFAMAILLFLDISDSEKALKNMPWDAILLVSGVSLLIGMLDKAGGLDLATTLIANISDVSYINATLAFITGIISAYSSSSGVVLPAFIPLIPELIEKMGGGDIYRMIIAVAVGSHMVDVSPLSTLGAICISAVPATSIEKNKLFRQLMLWGLSMAFVGAILSFFILDLPY